MAKIPKKKTFSKGLQSVQFVQEFFDQLLEDHGIRMKHIQVAICPNYTSIERGDHDLNCELCDNNYVEMEPVEFIGILTSQSIEKAYESMGIWQQGTGFMTGPAHIRLMHQDIIELTDAESVYNQLIEKSRTNTDKLRYRVTDVIFLRTAAKEYAIDTDFEISDSGRIKWISKNRPEEGDVITVRYSYKTRYRVISLMKENRDALIDFKNEGREHKAFPQQALVKLDYLIKDEDD